MSCAAPLGESVVLSMTRLCAKSSSRRIPQTPEEFIPVARQADEVHFAAMPFHRPHNTADEAIVIRLGIDKCEDDTLNPGLRGGLEEFQTIAMHQFPERIFSPVKDRLNKINGEVVVKDLEPGDPGERVGDRELADRRRPVNEDQPRTAAPLSH